MKKILVLIGVLLVSSGASFAQESEIYINVGQAQVKKSLLALTPLMYSGTQSANAKHIEAGQDLYRVITNDLNVSNFFTMISPDAYLEDPKKKGLKPAPGDANGFSFDAWKSIGTEFLTRASYAVLGDDLTMEMYVYHVPTKKVVLAKAYKGEVSGVRRLGHTFSNDLLQALTGKKGMFLSKLVASRQAPPSGGVPSHKEIYVMDWDGTNSQRITSHNSIAVSPAWSTDGKKVAYTAFAYHTANKTRNADLFAYDLGSGKRYMISYRKGINSGAAWMPGDKNLLMTLSQDGSADIYRVTADGTTTTPLTKGPNRAINVEPAISPDGTKIAFSSNRLGRPHIFVMNVDGSNPVRLTKVGNYNASPAWSPDGKTLAFAGDDKGRFDIFTMNIDGTNLKRLTSATKPNGTRADNEGPTWSPDGRHIAFTSNRTGTFQIYVVSPDGTNERRITQDNYNWDKPKWSPFLN